MTEFTEWRSLVDGEPISTIPDGLIDNFELEGSEPAGIYDDEDDLDSFYFGSNEFEIVDSSLGSGQRSVESTDTTTDAHVKISEPGDGLNEYPESEGTIRALLQDDPDGAQPILLCNATYDESEATFTGYGVIWAPQADVWILRKYINEPVTDADHTNLTDGSLNVTDDDTFLIELDLVSDNGVLEARAFEYNSESDEKGEIIDTLNAEDNDIPSSDTGVGFGASSSAVAKIDDIFVSD